MKAGPFSMSVCVECLCYPHFTHSLWFPSQGLVFFSLSMIRRLVFIWTITFSASKLLFSPIIYVQETMKPRLWPWDAWAFPLCEGWAGKRGPVHPSSQHNWKGVPCAEGISRKCVCEERPESLEAPCMNREGKHFLMRFHGPSWKERQGLPCHSHFKISHAEPACCLGKLFLSELVLRCLLHSFRWTCMAQCRFDIQLIVIQLFI